MRFVAEWRVMTEAVQAGSWADFFFFFLKLNVNREVFMLFIHVRR